MQVEVNRSKMYFFYFDESGITHPRASTPCSTELINRKTHLRPDSHVFLNIAGVILTGNCQLKLGCDYSIARAD